MTTDTSVAALDPAALDPLGDADALAGQAGRHNRAKVGSHRPSALLYTYGPGAILDLPQFTIMPAGLDDWDVIWRRSDSIPEIHAPRLRDVIRRLLRSRDLQLRPFPRQPRTSSHSDEGKHLGVPAHVFPQWLRCTGCDLLGSLAQFEYTNTHPYRTDQAKFEHKDCRGRAGGSRRPTRRSAVPARYLLVCPNGHLDEFPYDLWVHAGQPCPKVDVPRLKMVERTAGKGASAVIVCASCEARRGMNEAQGEAGRDKLPVCRARHPHLDAFDPEGCGAQVRLMLIGASNLWFAATQSIIVMPESVKEEKAELADRIRISLGERLTRYADDLETLRDVLQGRVDLPALSDDELRELVSLALEPPQPEALEEQPEWDPVDLLVPEWTYLQKDPIGVRHEDSVSGLALSVREVDAALPTVITRVLAVERLRKVNALFGFTRIDDLDRVGDLRERLAPLTRADRPSWTVATEDRGEGIFLQFDEQQVAQWEARVLLSDLWAAHEAAHRRNYENRFSETAAPGGHEKRFKPPRYWLLHTLAHVLIREAALSCGYGAASISERVYAWPGSGDRPPAAGLLLCTTAADSDGTLGGLVQLSSPERLQPLLENALYKATRCSSDPICAMRTPRDPEDFLHGAACHCCSMASETSCERANRFLDRRFLVDLPGCDLAFFDTDA
jgi:hypothetical protein